MTFSNCYFILMDWDRCKTFPAKIMKWVILLALFTPLSGWCLYNTAHCNDTPVVELTFPEPGMSVQRAEFFNMGATLVDTFYQEELKRELVEKYDSLKFSMLAYVDSVQVGIVPDTTFFNDTNFLVTQNQFEKIWFSPIANLKGDFPETTVVFEENWLFIPQSPEMTYSTLVDTPLVVFFDSAVSLKWDMFVQPTDGCYFEPTAYMFLDTGIVERGLLRKPGVSVPAREFLDAIGRSDVEVPPIRGPEPHQKNIQFTWDHHGIHMQGNDPVLKIELYSLRGQLVFKKTGDGLTPLDIPSGRFGQGLYYLKLEGASWHWASLFYPGLLPGRNTAVIELE